MQELLLLSQDKIHKYFNTCYSYISQTEKKKTPRNFNFVFHTLLGDNRTLMKSFQCPSGCLVVHSALKKLTDHTQTM